MEMKKNVLEPIELAKNWLLENKAGQSWKFPVICECYLNTALSLYVLNDEKRSNAVRFLIENKVWEKDLASAGLMALALKEGGETDLAEDIVQKIKVELGRKTPVKVDNKDTHIQKEIERLLWRVKLGFPLNIQEKDISKIPIYRILFKLTPEEIWYFPTSYFHDFFYSTAPMIMGKDEKLDKKILSVLKKSLSTDYSYASLTWATIISSHIFKKLGEEEYARKCLTWVEDRCINENGSLRNFLWQNVYDDLHICQALISLDEDVSDTIKFIEKYKIGPALSFASHKYFPDADDTALYLLIKKRLNLMGKGEYDTLRHILKTQNPDGGWSFNPLRSNSLFDITLKVVALVLNGLGRFSTVHKRGYGFLSMYRPTRNYQSVVDLTSRVLITLSYFKEEGKVRKHINRGVKFLWKHYDNGRFISPFCWTASAEVYETCMALIALYKNGVKNENTELAMEWVLSQKIDTAEEAAHVLLALMEGHHNRRLIDKMVDLIISKQLQDGSWNISVGFWVGPSKIYSLFSIAIPLFALAEYKNRYTSDKN